MSKICLLHAGGNAHKNYWILHWRDGFQKGEKSTSTFLFPSKVACQIAGEEYLQRLSMQIVDDKVTRDKSWDQLNSCWNQITQDHESVFLTGRMVQMYLHGLIHRPISQDNEGNGIQYRFQYMTQQYLQNGQDSWRPTVESLSLVLHRISDAQKARALLEHYLSLKDLHESKDSSLVCPPNVYYFVNVYSNMYKMILNWKKNLVDAVTFLGCSYTSLSDESSCDIKL